MTSTPTLAPMGRSPKPRSGRAAAPPGGAPLLVEAKPRRPRATAESMATRQRDISVSEFFAKNRHLLGFDNPRKALLTTVKEAVDNSLDACEEAGILPDVTVVIEDLSTSALRADASAKDPKKPVGSESRPTQSRYRVTIIDNGPGIVKKQVEHIFGRLLYGSKFHRLKMSRGQQGIGISAAGMYGLLTTCKPMVIHTRPGAGKPAHHIELAMNTKTNRAEVTVDAETGDFPPARLADLGRSALGAGGLPGAAFLDSADYPTGTSVSIELEGRYQRGRGSVDEFLELTAIANPHARITFMPPAKAAADEPEPELQFKPRRSKPIATAGGEVSGAPAAEPAPPPAPEFTTEAGGIIVFPRAVEELPPETREIQPHPRGVELGMLLQMLKEAEAERETYTLYNFLQDKFSRVSGGAAASLCKEIGVTSRTKAGDIDSATAERLYKALQGAKLPPPPTDCLAPIGVQQLLKGMFKGVRAEFYAASSREPSVYRGRPFLIEAAIAFGGQLPGDDTARVIRFANRVPLLFQQSACSSFKAVTETNWRNYDLQQPRGAVPVGALVIMIHMASVWVPFTSESKEAIADYDEIRREMKLALMECGRKLGAYLRKRLKMRRESERRDIFKRYIGEIAQACSAVAGTDAKVLYEALFKQAQRRTAIADAMLDDEGRTVTEDGGLDDGVVIVPSEPGARAAAPDAEAPGTPRKPRAAGSGRAPTPPGAATEKPVGPPKPRTRLVNGKLVPVEGGLF
ncbi:MAG: DNA topoisomerase VI subunit B [Phycisphaerales bacterium]|nr:DNA topoisomerase VI subunit B [Phycisphaerales bacterium]